MLLLCSSLSYLQSAEFSLHREIRAATRTGQAFDILADGLVNAGCSAVRLVELADKLAPMHRLYDQGDATGWWTYYIRMGLVSQDRSFLTARELKDGVFNWSEARETALPTGTAMLQSASLFGLQDMLTVVRPSADGGAIMLSLGLERPIADYSGSDRVSLVALASSVARQEDQLCQTRRLRRTA